MKQGGGENSSYHTIPNLKYYSYCTYTGYIMYTITVHVTVGAAFRGRDGGIYLLLLKRAYRLDDYVDIALDDVACDIFLLLRGQLECHPHCREGLSARLQTARGQRGNQRGSSARCIQEKVIESHFGSRRLRELMSLLLYVAYL